MSALGWKIPPIRMVDDPVWANFTGTTDPTDRCIGARGVGVDEQLTSGQRRGSLAAGHPEDHRAREVIGGDGGHVGERVADLELALVDRRDGGDAGHRGDGVGHGGAELAGPTRGRGGDDVVGADGVVDAAGDRLGERGAEHGDGRTPGPGRPSGRRRSAPCGGGCAWSSPGRASPRSPDARPGAARSRWPSGRATTGANIPIPMNRATAPSPTSWIAGLVSPATRAATPTTANTEPVVILRRDDSCSSAR